MAWIESHEEIGDHHKIHDLSVQLGCSVPTAVGHVHLLWHYTLRVAWRDGNLSKQSIQAICRGCWWDGDPNLFITALQQTGWLDGMIVHDWQEYASQIIYQRNYNATRRKERAKPPMDSKVTAVNTPATLPNLTKPNLTKPKDKDIKNIPTEEVGLDKEKAIATVLPKPDHVQFVDRFKLSYESMTGQPYNLKREHFVIASKLIKEHGLEMVVSKSKILGGMCRDQSAWFTKDGWAAFSIETLTSKWNQIIQKNKISAEDRDKADLMEKIQKERSKREQLNKIMGR